MGNLACKSKVKVPIVEVPCSAVHEHLIKCMKQYNGAIAQVDAVTGETITFDAILERAAALAAGLTARGLRVGEAAVIIGENNVHYPWVLLGVLQTGASAHLLDPRSTPREVKHALSISKPVVAMVSSGVSQIPGIADELRASTGMRCILVWGSNGPEMPEDPARGQSDVNQYEGDLPDGISSLQRLLASPVKSAISVPDSLESLETTETPLCLPETPTHSARVCAEAPPPMLGDMVLGPTPRGLGLLPRAPPSTPTHVSGSFGDSDSTTRSGDSSSLQQRLVHPSAVDRLTQPGLGQAGSPGSAVALILSSSGSTGLPKGVMITHDNLLAALELGPIFIKDDDVIAGVSPYFHAFGGLLMLMALCQGTPVVVIGKFSMSLLFDTVEKYKITALHVVTSVLVSLNKAPKEQLDRLESVRRIWSGAAQIAPLVQCSLQSILPDVLLGHSYGMTETTFTPLCGDVRADKPGSPGTLVPFMECRVVDPDTGMVLPRGCRGELHFRGPMVARGYLNNAEATAEAFDEDGWLKSGDLGFVDEDGYHYIVERLKDVLKYNGHQISPSELEALLMTHPAVQEAAIVGEPHEYGEAPRALVVLAEGQQVTEEELVTFIAGKVAPHKLLRGGVKFVTSPFPRTTSGKLQRKKLRALLEDDLNDSSSSETATVTTDQELSEAVAALSLDGLSDPSTPLQPSPDQRSISSE